MEALMIVFGILTICSAGGVVFASKSLHSALFLVLTLLLVAVHFALLGAEFLAVLQVLIYAGAIMVLVIFVIMLLGLDEVGREFSFSVPMGFAVVFACGFFALAVFAVSGDASFLAKQEAAFIETNVNDLGFILLTKYWFVLQVTGVLLLSAIVAAVLLAHEKKRPLKEGRGLRAVQQMNSKLMEES